MIHLADIFVTARVSWLSEDLKSGNGKKFS